MAVCCVCVNTLACVYMSRHTPTVMIHVRVHNGGRVATRKLFPVDSFTHIHIHIQGEREGER